MLLILLAACTQQPPPEVLRGPNLPYRVWASWEEMKEVLGDHYLYPAYLPEAIKRDEHVFKFSDYNFVPRDSDSDTLFFGYGVHYHSNRQNDSIFISATDENRNAHQPSNVMFPVPFHGRFQESDRFDEHAVTIGDIDVEFASFYAVFPPPDGESNPDVWFRHHARNGRAILYTFEIDAVTYKMSWVQFNVEDKHDDNELREAMLRVARSIIEQVREVE